MPSAIRTNLDLGIFLSPRWSGRWGSNIQDFQVVLLSVPVALTHMHLNVNKLLQGQNVFVLFQDF